MPMHNIRYKDIFTCKKCIHKSRTRYFLISSQMRLFCINMNIVYIHGLAYDCGLIRLMSSITPRRHVNNSKVDQVGTLLAISQDTMNYVGGGHIISHPPGGSGLFVQTGLMIILEYRQTSIIKCSTYQNLNASRVVLQCRCPIHRSHC